MTEAARAAGADSGAPGLLGRIERVAVPQGTWKYRDAGRLVTSMVGAPGARTVMLAAGIPQQTLFDDTYAEMLKGNLDVALVVGGEGAAADPVEGDDSDPDEFRRPGGEIVSPAELAAGVVSPPEQYALIDSALRYAEGQTVEEHRDAIAGLWAGFSQVAARFPHAAHRVAKTAAEIRDPGAGNRPISFPYNKWHCSQMRVNQAAALLICTLATAEGAGADPARAVFPLLALESSHSLALPRRRCLHRWEAMEVLAGAASEHLGAPISGVEHIEVYSCFPAAVRVQQRALGLPAGDVPTITGGMAFAGGPWNNYVLQATVAMIELLREDRGSRGLVTTVSGFLTKPGIALYCTEPGPRPLLVADLASLAQAATPAVPLAVDHEGTATVAACTVSYPRTGDARTIVICDTPAGERCLATSTDPALAVRATTDELVGNEVTVGDGGFDL
jgi:acetyl-CoA C-acetyltransferase